MSPTSPSPARKTCRNEGSTARAVEPIIESSTGTSRQPSTRRPSEAAIFSTADRGLVGLGPVGGQEGDAGGVGALGRQREADHLAEEPVGDLDQDAGAVAGVDLAARRAPVLEVAQRADALAHDVVAAQALHVDDEVDAAGVVFERGVVEALGGRQISHEVVPGAIPGLGMWSKAAGTTLAQPLSRKSYTVPRRIGEPDSGGRVTSPGARTARRRPRCHLVHRRVPVAVPRRRPRWPAGWARRLRRGGRGRRVAGGPRAARFLRRGGSVVAWVGRPAAAAAGLPRRRRPHRQPEPAGQAPARPVVGRLAPARRRGLRRRAAQLVARPRPRPVGSGRRPGPDGPELRLFRDDRPLLRVPQLAIHLDREIDQTGLKLNPQLHLTPIWGLGATDVGGFVRYLGSPDRRRRRRRSSRGTSWPTTSPAAPSPVVDDELLSSAPARQPAVVLGGHRRARSAVAGGSAADGRPVDPGRGALRPRGDRQLVARRARPATSWRTTLERIVRPRAAIGDDLRPGAGRLPPACRPTAPTPPTRTTPSATTRPTRSCSTAVR